MGSFSFCLVFGLRREKIVNNFWFWMQENKRNGSSFKPQIVSKDDFPSNTQIWQSNSQIWQSSVQIWHSSIQIWSKMLKYDSQVFKSDSQVCKPDSQILKSCFQWFKVFESIQIFSSILLATVDKSSFSDILEIGRTYSQPVAHFLIYQNDLFRKTS